MCSVWPIYYISEARRGGKKNSPYARIFVICAPSLHRLPASSNYQTTIFKNSDVAPEGKGKLPILYLYLYLTFTILISLALDVRGLEKIYYR